MGIASSPLVKGGPGGVREAGRGFGRDCPPRPAGHAARGEPGAEPAHIGGGATARASRLDQVARHHQARQRRTVKHP